MNKFKAFWLKIWNYIKYVFKHPKDTLLPALLAEIVFWMPVWIPAILALIISPWWWTVVGAVIAFWAGPLTPAIALQVGLIALFEKGWNRIRKKKENKNNDR